MKNKYLKFSDTHFNFSFLWGIQRFVDLVLSENPFGIIITGDIACGISLISNLTYLAKKLEHMPIYFIIGNHDYYGSSFTEMTEKLLHLTKKFANLKWIAEKDYYQLNNETCLLGDNGWYDARLGNPLYTNYNFDWIMIKEFRELKTYEAKLKYTRQIADESTNKIITKLKAALQQYKTIYLCSHVPPWREATRDLGTILEDFWLPYNVNSELGKQIETLMVDFPKQNVVVLAGHTHTPCDIRIAHNIECQVQAAKYVGLVKNKHHLFV